MIFLHLEHLIVIQKSNKNYEKVIIKKSKDKIIFHFRSKSFLRNQVRSMVGCLKLLGEEKWSSVV